MRDGYHGRDTQAPNPGAFYAQAAELVGDNGRDVGNKVTDALRKLEEYPRISCLKAQNLICRKGCATVRP